MNDSHLQSVDGRWGKVHFFNTDEYVGKSLHHYGEYNPDETECLLDLAEKAGKSKLVLDIGANFGVMAQALEYNGFRVEAFEPQPEIFKILRKNFSGKSHNTAVGNQYGTTIMAVVDYTEPNNFGAMFCGSQSELGAFRVPVIPLDAMNYQDVGLIKIDVEGFEEEVLRGAHETIVRCRPVLYVEDDKPLKREGLYSFLTELEYKWQRHEPSLFRSQNFFDKAENVWGKNYASSNIICHF